jgi:hypothetical protein
VVALHRSLAAVGAAHPLIVLYSDTCSASALAELDRLGISCRRVECFDPVDIDHAACGYYRPLYQECWSKLRMWEMVEYTRLAYLDADMVVKKNVDFVFDLPAGAFYAVGDCTGGRLTGERRSFFPSVLSFFRSFILLFLMARLSSEFLFSASLLPHCLPLSHPCALQRRSVTAVPSSNPTPNPPTSTPVSA